MQGIFGKRGHRSRRWGKSVSALGILALLQPALLQPVAAFAEMPPVAADDRSIVVLGGNSDPAIAAFAADAMKEPKLSHAQKVALLRKKVKYVFVLFQENRSFDADFGTFPKANGLFSKPADQTPGFSQPLVDTDGTVGTIKPFKIPQAMYPADTESVNHNHGPIAEKMDVGPDGQVRNDRFALVEEGVKLKGGQPDHKPTLAQKQMGELVMSYIDCDTIPLLWRLADRFTLFDDFYDTIVGPSTPNALAVFAGQSGQTQWARHPDQKGLPVVDDANPYWGSKLDKATGQPVNPSEKKYDESMPAPNQTYASLSLSFAGKAVAQLVKADRAPETDLADVHADVKYIAGHNRLVVPWGWYEEGYDHEPTDGAGPASHLSYIPHHAAPQYFGYITNNPKLAAHMHGLGDFYTDIKAGKLPKSGGVFYLRGGYGNLDGLTPVLPDRKVAKQFIGDDDHPTYSDTQIAEALVADEVNAIAASPYWKDSAIIITYDESDGLYDHAQPRIRSHDAQGRVLADGGRIPTILISPYARAHVITHEQSEHNSVIKFIDEVYGLTPLADLPDEAEGRELGRKNLHQDNLGPADDKVPDVGDMLSAFDNARLMGRKKPLPAGYAEIPADIVHTLPHYGADACQAVHIVPTDVALGIANPVPADFNPRPKSEPTPVPKPAAPKP